MADHLHRLDELCAAYGLPSGASRRLAAVLEALRDEPVSLTTVRDPREAADVHVADALTALEITTVRGAMRIADVGSGAGFPGLVLAVALPEAEVVLVESVARKGEWLRRAAELAGASNVEVVTARAEEWRDGLGRHDLVTARAVAPLSVLLEYAAPLLAEGGHLVAWKGRLGPAEERDARAAGDALGMERAEERRTAPWPEAEDHTLHLWSKVRPTPPRFPRRAGMARKRPLVAST